MRNICLKIFWQFAEVKKTVPFYHSLSRNLEIKVHPNQDLFSTDEEAVLDERFDGSRILSSASREGDEDSISTSENLSNSKGIE